VFATIGLRNQGWAITSKSTRFADFAALADVDANVLRFNVLRGNPGRNFANACFAPILYQGGWCH
jgi:hypothetical protein